MDYYAFTISRAMFSIAITTFFGRQKDKPKGFGRIFCWNWKWHRCSSWLASGHKHRCILFKTEARQMNCAYVLNVRFLIFQHSHPHSYWLHNKNPSQYWRLSEAFSLWCPVLSRITLLNINMGKYVPTIHCFLCDKHIERTHLVLISKSPEMCLDTGHMWRAAWEPDFGFTITQLLSAKVSRWAKRAKAQRSVEPKQETPVEASCAATTQRLTQWHSKANWCRKPI